MFGLYGGDDAVADLDEFGGEGDALDDLLSSEAFGGDDEEDDETAYAGEGEDDNDDDEDLDARLESLEGETDQELANYGGDYEWYGAGGALARGDLAPNYVDAGFDQNGISRLALVFLPTFLDQSWYKWLGEVAPTDSLLKEAEDIARNFQRTPEVLQWQSLTDDQKVDLLDTVLLGSIVGNHIDAIDVARQQIDNVFAADGFWNTVKAAGSGWYQTVKTLLLKDAWVNMKAAIPGSDEQSFNSLAYALYVTHKWGAAVRALNRTWVGWVMPDALVDFATGVADRYPILGNGINLLFADGGLTVSQAGSQAGGNVPVRMPSGGGGYAEDQVEAPSGFPIVSPPTILALGYAVMTGLAVLG